MSTQSPFWMSRFVCQCFLFFRTAFPTRSHFRVLIDREPLLPTDEEKLAFAQFGISAMADWPKYSPDLNPKENVWSWAEKSLRRTEKKSDTFAIFCRKLLRVVRRYPSAEALIPKNTKSRAGSASTGGAMTKY